MTEYIFGVILYLIVGYILSLVFGFRFKAGEGTHVLLIMLIWPIVLLLVVVWVIEDVITYFQKRV